MNLDMLARMVRRQHEWALQAGLGSIDAPVQAGLFVLDAIKELGEPRWREWADDPRLPPLRTLVIYSRLAGQWRKFQRSRSPLAVFWITDAIRLMAYPDADIDAPRPTLNADDAVAAIERHREDQQLLAGCVPRPDGRISDDELRWMVLAIAEQHQRDQRGEQAA